jgi:MFS family permease
LTLLTDYLGWRPALYINSGLGLLLLIVIIIYVQDFPQNLGTISLESHRAQLQALGFWNALWQTVGNRQNWLSGLYTSLMNLPIFLLGAMWGSLYLVQMHNLTRAQSSYVTSMIFIGTIIGSPVLGWFSDRIGRRVWPMIVSAVLSLIVILLLMYMPHLTLWTLMLLFFLLGFITSAQIISYPLIAESNPSALVGSAGGLASTLIMAGGISQPFFGWLMELNWNGAKIAEVPVYSAHDYHLALAIMPIGFVIALVAAFFLREK